MPIQVTCTSCGKKLRLPDDRVGKMAKFPGCMNTFKIAPDGAAAPMMAAPAGVGLPGRKTALPVSKPGEKGPKVEISGGMLALIIGVVVVGGGIALLVFGPLRVR